MSELNEFSRAELLLGEEGIEKLRKARVAVFGIGGVGSFVAEALARGGVGHLALVDGDVVSLTNINRQLIATQKTIGRRKTSVMAERIHEILPETEVVEYPVVYGAENRDLLDFASYDYIVDAIDTVTSKLILIEKEKRTEYRPFFMVMWSVNLQTLRFPCSCLCGKETALADSLQQLEALCCGEGQSDRWFHSAVPRRESCSLPTHP